MLETDAANVVQVSYVSSDCGCPSAEKRLISQTQNGDTHYYLQDALGSTRALTKQFIIRAFALIADFVV